MGCIAVVLDCVSAWMPLFCFIIWILYAAFYGLFFARSAFYTWYYGLDSCGAIHGTSWRWFPCMMRGRACLVHDCLQAWTFKNGAVSLATHGLYTRLGRRYGLFESLSFKHDPRYLRFDFLDVLDHVLVPECQRVVRRWIRRRKAAEALRKDYFNHTGIGIPGTHVVQLSRLIAAYEPVSPLRKELKGYAEQRSLGYNPESEPHFV